MTDAPGRIVSINVSAGGVPKKSVPHARLSRLGVAGDGHDNPKLHGGPDRAVCIYSAELIAALRQEGHPIFPGSTGENLTVAGVDWGGVLPGTIWRAGAALLEVTSFTSPCKTIGGSFVGRRYKRISQKVHPGWSRVYARVLDDGEAAEGDSFVREGVQAQLFAV